MVFCSNCGEKQPVAAGATICRTCGAGMGGSPCRVCRKIAEEHARIKNALHNLRLDRETEIQIERIIDKREGYMVVAPSDMMDKLPDDVRSKVEKMLDGFADGTIDPLTVGDPMKLRLLNDLLPCEECDSKDTVWSINDADPQGDKDVFYRCRECGNHNIISEQAYNEAITKHPTIVTKRKVERETNPNDALGSGLTGRKSR